MKLNISIGAAAAALCILFVPASVLMTRHSVVHAATVMAPRFEVDPYWPKPLPNHWVTGSTIGVSTDSQDHVWIIHRPARLKKTSKPWI
jgi:hypothetical protein